MGLASRAGQVARHVRLLLSPNYPEVSSAALSSHLGLLACRQRTTHAHSRRCLPFSAWTCRPVPCQQQSRLARCSCYADRIPVSSCTSARVPDGEMHVTAGINMLMGSFFTTLFVVDSCKTSTAPTPPSIRRSCRMIVVACPGAGLAHRAHCRSITREMPAHLIGVVALLHAERLSPSLQACDEHKPMIEQHQPPRDVPPSKQSTPALLPSA